MFRLRRSLSDALDFFADGHGKQVPNALRLVRIIFDTRLRLRRLAERAGRRRSRYRCSARTAGLG